MLDKRLSLVKKGPSPPVFRRCVPADNNAFSGKSPLPKARKGTTIPAIILCGPFARQSLRVVGPT